MRDALDNPFSPGSDIVPEVWAGRTQQLNDWRDVLRPRRMAGLPERGRTILGEPGLGKSSLVRRIADDARVRGDWVTPQLRIPSGADPLKLVAAAVLDLANQAGLATRREKRIRELIARVESVEASGFALTLRDQEGPEPYRVLGDILVEVGRAARKQNCVALIHIDEVQNITNENVLSQLLIALGDAIGHEDDVELPGGLVARRTLPLAVYLTGLPDFEDRAGAHKGATFARRFQTTILTGIDDEDLNAALRQFVVDGWEVPDGEGGTARVRMEQNAADAVVDLCRGEPFLFQLAGEKSWYAGSGETITLEQVRAGWRGAESEAGAHIERIVSRLPQRERDFLRAMADLPAERRRFSIIAAEAGFAKATDAGPTAQRLDTIRRIIKRGSKYSFQHRAVEAYMTTDWPSID
ncbi:ATP-binding protein [Curtobacterium sp. RRHDQ66]|uniref:ATP-binding protein n=1 Tax=Curtobacterium guangdongense TaxID=3413380 RepID=UPI003BF22F01